jgi:hypothetical protein
MKITRCKASHGGTGGERRCGPNATAPSRVTEVNPRMRCNGLFQLLAWKSEVFLAVDHEL